MEIPLCTINPESRYGTGHCIQTMLRGELVNVTVLQSIKYDLKVYRLLLGPHECFIYRIFNEDDMSLIYHGLKLINKFRRFKKNLFLTLVLYFVT